MLNYNKRIIKIHLLILTLTLSIIPKAYSDYVGIAFDSDEAPALREAIFNPFIINGRVPISENQLSYYTSDLPNPIPNFWQVISINRDTLEKYCQSGDLLSLNWSNFPHQTLLNPTAMHTCGVGHSVSSTVMAYSIIHKYGLPPNQWSDFFDLNRYPGKRALPTHSRALLEIALLADGVRQKDLYPLLQTKKGRDRAFAKWDTIKDDVIWWDDINELKQWLMNGDVALAITHDGPLLYADGRDNIGVVRNNVIYRIRYYAIPKAAKNKELSYSFISYATHPNRQKKLYTILPYGPTIEQGWALFSDYEQQYLTNFPKNLKNALAENYQFYIDYGADIAKQYQKWHTGYDLAIQPVTVSYEETDSTIIEIEDATDHYQLDPDFVGPPIPKNLSNINKVIDPSFMGPPERNSLSN